MLWLLVGRQRLSLRILRHHDGIGAAEHARVRRVREHERPGGINHHQGIAHAEEDRLVLRARRLAERVLLFERGRQALELAAARGQVVVGGV